MAGRGRIRAGAILTRLREVLTQAAGTARTLETGRVGVAPGTTDGEQAFRGLDAPGGIEARVWISGRHPMSPGVMGNLEILTLECEVTQTRAAGIVEQLTDADRDALLAWQVHADDGVRQALEYSGNLTSTTAGEITDLVSGRLVYQGSQIGVRGEAGSAQVYEVVSRYQGAAIARPTSAEFSSAFDSRAFT